MKFCEKCGTQLSDEIVVCPQCQHQMKQQSLPKKKFNKMILIIPLIVIITVAATFTCAYFVLPTNPSTESSSNNDSNKEKTSTANSDNVCPADEYGNHEWSKATCERPSYCYECGAYKDDKLGHHNFELDEDTGLVECWYCNMLKSDYDSE